MESILIVAGLILCSLYGLMTLYTLTSSKVLVSSFVMQAMAPGENAPSNRHFLSRSNVDFSDWSEKRIAAYKRALAMVLGAPIAIVAIPKLNLEVPVLNGTDSVLLDRGVGRIPGTARPDEESGNLAIAGHRDGFFRGLKNIEVGDTIVISSPKHRRKYVVDNIKVVPPEDISVLEDRTTPSVTLVTCYPFYFIGDAPLRYIVQAALAEMDQKVAK